LAFSRFFQLPLMEEKKVPSVMQYEAASQIPFKLEDIVWDYQVLYRHDALRRDICEREMALFAIRHEHLDAAVAPLKELGLRPAVVQSQCAALHNLMAYDRLADGKLPGGEDLRFNGLEPAVAVLDVGGEAANLVISGDGASWCRSLPLGGQQFSQVLVDVHQFTLAQAEKWKRQPAAGANLLQSYQALQPSFGELAAEVRRSVEYYLSTDRKRRIVQMLVVGDGSRQHGLLKHLWLDA
jgi:type IV pilus assembly protein PilM